MRQWIIWGDGSNGLRNGLALFLAFSAHGCGTAGETASPGADAGPRGNPTPDGSAWSVTPPATSWSPPSSASGPVSLPDAGAAEPPAPPCIAEGGIDEPDDAFADTNCDGIDGDASIAVFVSATGSDDGAGTIAAPLKTLQHAVDVAQKRGKRAIYACNGEYPENVLIADTPVDVYGGYDCERGWKRVPDIVTLAPTNGVPLTIRNVPGALVVDRVATRSASAVDAGGSSIATVIAGSAQVTLRRVEFTAGDGKAGKDGAAVIAPVWPSQSAVAGEDLTGVAPWCVSNDRCRSLSGRDGENDPSCLLASGGGHGPERVCPDHSIIYGGSGGNGGNCGQGLVSTSGSAGRPASPSAQGVAGREGASGAPGPGFGRIRGEEYVPIAASDGAWGETGTAGHGGDGSNGVRSGGDPGVAFQPGGGGGQGGYPGCGAPGGNGGGGGGGSIALLVISSQVTLASSHLVTGDGGDGGTPSYGVTGQPGGSGAPGGHGDNVTAGQAGYAGGAGGNGGLGGPGGGGPSVGIVSTGIVPMTTDTTFELGAGGNGATGAQRAANGQRSETFNAGYR